MPKVMVDLDKELNEKIEMLQAELKFEGEKLKKPEVIVSILKETGRNEIKHKILGDENGER